MPALRKAKPLACRCWLKLFLKGSVMSSKVTPKPKKKYGKKKRGKRS
jgi:hypothetical protein